MTPTHGEPHDQTGRQNLKGKVAVVTGGGTGIGAAIVKRFAASGASVVVSGRRSGPIQEVAGEVGGISVAGDISEREVCEEIVSKAQKSFGGLDIIVSNAGVVRVGSVVSEREEDWEETLKINLSGVRMIARVGIPALQARGGGAILNISSVAGLSAAGDMASYIASKAAVIGLTKSMAYDFGPQNIRVNAICPGWVLTPMAEDEMAEFSRERGITTEEALDYFTRYYPLRRMADPDEVASCAEFLVSDSASYVTGVSLPVDGGSEVVDVGTLGLGAEC